MIRRPRFGIGPLGDAFEGDNFADSLQPVALDALTALAVAEVLSKTTKRARGRPAVSLNRTISATFAETDPPSAVTCPVHICKRTVPRSYNPAPRLRQRLQPIRTYLQRLAQCGYDSPKVTPRAANAQLPHNPTSAPN
jgi:hypothetical protein